MIVHNIVDREGHVHTVRVVTSPVDAFNVLRLQKAAVDFTDSAHELEYLIGFHVNDVLSRFEDSKNTFVFEGVEVTKISVRVDTTNKYVELTFLPEKTKLVFDFWTGEDR